MILNFLFLNKQVFINFNKYNTLRYSISSSIVLKKKTIKDKFIKFLLVNGNKGKVENLFLEIIKEIQKSTKKQYLNVFKLSVLNNYTVLMLKSSKNQKFKRKNQKKTMIPFLLKKQNRILLSLKSIIFISKKNSKNSFFLSLKLELINKFLELKTKNMNEELYKLIFLKKNFAHYRWFI